MKKKKGKKFKTADADRISTVEQRKYFTIPPPPPRPVPMYRMNPTAPYIYMYIYTRYSIPAVLCLFMISRIYTHVKARKKPQHHKKGNFNPLQEGEPAFFIFEKNKRNKNAGQNKRINHFALRLHSTQTGESFQSYMSNVPSFFSFFRITLLEVSAKNLR